MRASAGRFWRGTAWKHKRDAKTGRNARGLQDVNRRACRHFEDAYPPAGGPRPLDVFATDADGKLVGGVLGATIWNWLRIDGCTIRHGGETLFGVRQHLAHNA